MRWIFQCPERVFLVVTVKQRREQSKRLSRTWFRHNHIEYPEMFLGPTFPRFRRYIPEEDLAIQEDARGRNDQPISQPDPLLPDALDLNGRRRSPSEDILQPGWIPQRGTCVELPDGGTFEYVGE